MSLTDKSQDKPFVPLGGYEWPKLPTEDRLRLAINRFKNEVFRSNSGDEPAVAADRLEGIPLERLNRIAAPPAYGKLLDELDLTMNAWIAAGRAGSKVQLIVMPPCDDIGIVKTWAESQGITCLNAPTRDEVLGETGPAMPDLGGEGILVIPNLERWFLRHRKGLRTVRLLLAAISATKRRCVIGCNSWAWTYLSATIDADLQLPGGVTFQAFDKERLHHWFSGLAHRPNSEVKAFRISESGKNVFATDEDGAIKSDFFQKLAARSLGIPWVAWSLWRHSLRETREADTTETEAGAKVEDDDDDMIWIAELEDFVMPTAQRQNALLIFHSLLIHGALSVEHLSLTVPFGSQINLVETLMRAGFVKLENGLLSCLPAAYPTIRRELANAGYSMDRL
ncbi:hypothetical protein [Sulfitobacter guttiformis]|uniref:Uncharacterized protein n=1 Tax=Sulfitobacter guttiformis TaxID=74349 RepID=A0A420DPD1_9RHOB|nr:hypothetical protein [Sulfitobacter guttiformis]KIN73469.1 hypothetical protein Z949_2659 [Sulfitobacter guttiformis KCTC 32187]RKE96131.1 hypothetical protein C8N30_0682 [Sulfitobacter guttiformis]